MTKTPPRRRVLVTGGAGFIGSHVVETLLARGDAVEAIDDLSKGQVTNLPDAVPLHVVDITSRAAVERVFAQRRFDAVVHCAAQTNVMRSLAEPELDRRINLDGLRHVLVAAVASRARRFVFISSGGAIYGETPVPATEASPPRPTNPYGQHKLEGERIVESATISACSLRLSNVYGPRQRSDAEGGVIAIFAERIARGLPLRVFGDGEQQRDFVHVDDVVSAVMLALDTPSLRGAWNVATGGPTSVNELVGMVSAAAPSPPAVARLPGRGEVRRSCLDVTKLRSLGWQPRRDLREALTGLVQTAATVPG